MGLNLITVLRPAMSEMRIHREEYGLRGQVQSVRIQSARIEEKAEKLLFSQSLNFDQEGRLLEQIDGNPDGSLWSTIYNYSNSGRLMAMRSYDASGVLNGEWTYFYDDDGRLKAEHYLTQYGEVRTPTTYAYDSEGKKTKIQEYDFAEESNVLIGIEGTQTSVTAGDARRVETTYDSRGAAIRVNIFNSEGDLVRRVEIKRDVLGNPLEETQYVGDVFRFSSCGTDSCSLENLGPLNEEQQAELAEVARLFSPGTAMSTHTHRYDTAGRLVESELTMLGMTANRQTFTYDEFDNKSEEVSYGEDGKLESKTIFTREYDGYGNWTEELISTASSWDAEFSLSTPAQVTHRVITYW